MESRPLRRLEHASAFGNANPDFDTRAVTNSITNRYRRSVPNCDALADTNRYRHPGEQ